MFSRVPVCFASLQDPVELRGLQVRRRFTPSSEADGVCNGATVREHLDAPDAGSDNQAAVRCVLAYYMAIRFQGLHGTRRHPLPSCGRIMLAVLRMGGGRAQPRVDGARLPGSVARSWGSWKLTRCHHPVPSSDHHRPARVHAALDFRGLNSTETVFANEAIKPPRNRSVRHDGNTTVQFRAATGLYRPGCGIENNCELISRGSTAVPCVFAKTHSPFLVTKAAERLGFTGSDVGIGTAALVAVRNPLDNYDGWRRYKASKSTKETREGTEASFAAFLQSWSDHINHWGRNSERHGVPTVFYRYEDLTSGVCREQIVRAAVKLSGLWDALELTDLDSLRAAEAYPPHDDAGERIATATGKHGAKYAREDIELALSSPLVRRFGYDTILHSWLKSADGKWQEDSGPKLGLRCYRIWPDTEANPPGKS